MKKYYLPCPIDTQNTLRIKGQIGDIPIYLCKNTNTFWVLTFGSDFKRCLIQFDNTNLKFIKAQTYPVPEDWAGEPKTYVIDLETWGQIQNSDNTEIRSSVIELLKTGDHFILLSEDDKIIGRIECLFNSENEVDELVLK